VLDGSAPATQTVAANGSGLAVYTMVYRATEAGLFGLNGNLSGRDARTNAVITSVDALSNNVLIEEPAELVSAISVQGSTTVDIGQTVTIVMTVTNNGQAYAMNTLPNNMYIKAGSTGGLIQISAPVAAVHITGGASALFTWRYSAAGTGLVSVSGNATGADQHLLTGIKSDMSTSDVVTVQTPANLIAALSAWPVSVGTGQYITVILTVTNNGQARAVNIVPSITAPVGAVTLQGTVQPTTQDIGGLTAGVFTWSGYKRACKFYSERGRDG
jgi:uncharacterized repeat protein (TIGR01451 family)